MENTQPLNDKKILVVDDELDIIESLEELLEDTFMVDSASSFEEAVSCPKSDLDLVLVISPCESWHMSPENSCSKPLLLWVNASRRSAASDWFAVLRS